MPYDFGNLPRMYFLQSTFIELAALKMGFVNSIFIGPLLLRTCVRKNSIELADSRDFPQLRCDKEVRQGSHFPIRQRSCNGLRP